MARVRALMALLVTCLWSASASADYSPPALNDLVLTSDAIVEGEVVALSADTFEFHVTTSVAGSPSSGHTIVVERFQDWMCATRWAPYAAGQRLLLFLRARPGQRWQIRSAGGEGEMPIVNGHVYVTHYGELVPSGASAYARHSVYGGDFVGFALDRDRFLDALRRARACFVADFQAPPPRRVRATCPDAPQTPLAAALFQAMVP